MNCKHGRPLSVCAECAPERQVRAVQWVLPVEVALYFASLISFANATLDEASKGGVSKGYPFCCQVHLEMFKQVVFHNARGDNVDEGNRCLYELAQMLEANGVITGFVHDAGDIPAKYDELMRRLRD